MAKGKRGSRIIDGEKFIEYSGGNKTVVNRLAKGFRALDRKVRIIKRVDGSNRVFVSGPWIDYWWNKVK